MLNDLASGGFIFIIMIIISAISIFIAGLIYFPFIENDVRSKIEFDKRNKTVTTVKQQTLDQFDQGDL